MTGHTPLAMTILNPNSFELLYTSGWKYQLVENITWRLRVKFKNITPYSGRYYRLFYFDGHWHITAYLSCCWDGPTNFPDFKWMMFASLIHDILHWLIAKGHISTRSNDAIDAELAGIVRIQPHRFANFRAWYIEKATNTVDQKLGQEKTIHRLEVYTGMG